MFVKVDLGPHPPVVSLEEPDDCTRFHLAVAGGNDLMTVYGALIHAAAGRLEDGQGLIAIDAVRRLSAGRVGDDWDRRFDAMLGHARTRGWIDETNNAIQAHIDYVDA